MSFEYAVKSAYIVSYPKPPWSSQSRLSGGIEQDSADLRYCWQDRKKKSAKASRIFRRFHAHGLIAKIPRTRRWRVTPYGSRVMGASHYIRDQYFPEAYSIIAA